MEWFKNKYYLTISDKLSYMNPTQIKLYIKKFMLLEDTPIGQMREVCNYLIS